MLIHVVCVNRRTLYFGSGTAKTILAALSGAVVHSLCHAGKALYGERMEKDAALVRVTRRYKP